MDLSPKIISNQEEEWSRKLPEKKAQEYKYTRGLARYALSNLFNIEPKNIPLKALPGEAPILQKGWGYISMSHCNDLLLIGWSPKKIGIDIERSDRSFPSKKIVKRYFSDNEKQSLKNSNQSDINTLILSHWAAKEASIKWHQGRLFQDLLFWEWDISKNLANHKILGYKTNIEIISYQKWIIAIASDLIQDPQSIFICSHEKNI